MYKQLFPTTGFIKMLGAYAERYPSIFNTAVGVLKFVFPVLALIIIVSAVKRLLKVPNKPEVWARLKMPDGSICPLSNWENIIGRSGKSDVILKFATISRQHAAIIRNEDGSWTLHDLAGKKSTCVNDTPIIRRRLEHGDVFALGGAEITLLPPPETEDLYSSNRKKAEGKRAKYPVGSFLVITLFQLLALVQLTVSYGSAAPGSLYFLCPGLTIVMWVYFIFLRILGCGGLEMEEIVFWLSTLSLSVTASAAPGSMFKQFATICAGIVFMIVIELLIRDLKRVKKLRWLAAAATVGLLLFTIVCGTNRNGATAWISLGAFSFQPSEIAKVCYIFAGAATLDRLFVKRNFGMFILLTMLCLGCLALMNDFGTALIFFIVFLVIIFLRSGDYTAVMMICAAAGFGGVLLLKFKSHIVSRFEAWGKVWQFTDSLGFQQTRAMSAAASGGIVGKGAGNGWLKNVFAADTDLVFGMLCEEWGLIIAVLAVISVVVLCVFAVRASKNSRSSFYTISACAATSLLVFSMMLNVFGTVDLLPLTGVTFPFVSNGGSSMICCWGLLAFLKSTDARPNSNIAVKVFENYFKKSGKAGKDK